MNKQADGKCWCRCQRIEKNIILAIFYDWKEEMTTFDQNFVLIQKLLSCIWKYKINKPRWHGWTYCKDQHERAFHLHITNMNSSGWTLLHFVLVTCHCKYFYQLIERHRSSLFNMKHLKVFPICFQNFVQMNIFSHKELMQQYLLLLMYIKWLQIKTSIFWLCLNAITHYGQNKTNNIYCKLKVWCYFMSWKLYHHQLLVVFNHKGQSADFIWMHIDSTRLIWFFWNNTNKGYENEFNSLYIYLFLYFWLYCLLQNECY